MPKQRSTASKSVSWADELMAEELEPPCPKLHSSQTTEDGTPTFALKRSMKLMGCLYELRRANEPDGILLPPGANPKEDLEDGEPDEALLVGTLHELFDTAEGLEVLQEKLADGCEGAAECGGRRHATAIVTMRTLAVVRRKRMLLESVETRLRSFRMCHAKREELLPKIVDGTGEAPPEMLGIKKFISQHTHPGGDPGDANRSDFSAFVASFKLPYDHVSLQSMRDTSLEVGEWWADACLDEAVQGGTHGVLSRLIAVAMGAGIDKDHPKIIKAERILNDRLCDKVLEDAETSLDVDTEAALRATRIDLVVGLASKAADNIDSDIAAAVSLGCKANDRRLKDAEAISVKLRETEGERKRKAGALKRQQQRAKG